MKLVAEGFTSQIFKWDEEHVLKLYRPPFSHIAKREFEIMQFLSDYNLSIPYVIEMLEVDGRSGYVMQEINGLSFKDLLEDDMASVQRYANALGKLHARVHQCDVPSGYFSQIISRIGAIIQKGEKALSDLNDPVQTLLGKVQEGKELCHNDFHFGNVLEDKSGLWMVDWNGAGFGDIHADVAKSIILMTYAPIGLCLGPQAHQDRVRIVQIYLDAYISENDLDAGLLKMWQIIRAAELISLHVPFADDLVRAIRELL